MIENEVRDITKIEKDVGEEVYVFFRGMEDNIPADLLCDYKDKDKKKIVYKGVITKKHYDCYKNAVYNITYEDNDTEAAVYGDYIIPTYIINRQRYN